MLLLGIELPKSHAIDSSSVILVAEDEVVVRNVVCLLLQREGYQVMSAADGQEALDLARNYNGTIDLLLSDLKMPGLDGLSLAEQVVRERPGIRVLLMSGKVSGDIREHNIRLPFLRQPFVSSAFRNKVREVLSGPPAEPQQI